MLRWVSIAPSLATPVVPLVYWRKARVVGTDLGLRYCVARTPRLSVVEAYPRAGSNTPAPSSLTWRTTRLLVDGDFGKPRAGRLMAVVTTCWHCVPGTTSATVFAKFPEHHDRLGAGILDLVPQFARCRAGWC